MSYITYAQWFGIISVLLALGILFNLEDAKKMAQQLIPSESGYIMGGVLPIIFGSLAFIHTQTFQINWQLVVYLIGAVMVLMGMYRVIFIEHWKKLMTKHIDQIPALFSLFGLIFGLLLLYIGFVSESVSYPIAKI